MTVKTLPALLDKMWQDYIAINPLAKKISDLLVGEGEKILNDHIALRTFNHPRVGVDVMAKPFIEAGYKYSGDYHFPEKKLYAKHYEHPDHTLPKIFISELKLEEFSPELRKTVNSLVDQIPAGAENAYDFVSTGRPWKVTTKIYQDLMKESDYAAWVSAFGYRPNHFTVFINELKKYSDILVLNDHLKAQGFKLNASGGEVKGSKEVCLEQSSTLANNIEVTFDDGKLTIPACYYEFAKRYPMKNGQLYQGFVAASADKIFESTSKGQ
ncbi:DUF1338 domain-containing protein [Peredibacter starrii]|uniref:2-oxoadipate dioxygenase/decarboxylase n=1 Tax=Peredibacter starrii TaxID=28202 RepID=A0AAX4HSD3_9BACT|nr:DUF1338 domain-containing protein [Peredibacter starrii]WPU66095.1 DUF1338 domain-containing protein [Peredibacter starrii]